MVIDLFLRSFIAGLQLLRNSKIHVVSERVAQDKLFILIFLTVLYLIPFGNQLTYTSMTGF